MKSNPLLIFEQKKNKIKQRKAIDQEIKAKLILSVVNDRLSIYQAAILHKVKYSSAKHILRNYYKDSANFFLNQKKRKRKMFCNNFFILVDTHSGSIQFKKQQTHSISCTQNGANPALQQKFLSQLSNAIFLEVNPLKKNLGIGPKEPGDVQQQLYKLIEIIKKQHNEMTKLKELY